MVALLMVGVSGVGRADWEGLGLDMVQRDRPKVVWSSRWTVGSRQEWGVQMPLWAYGLRGRLWSPTWGWPGEAEVDP